METYFDPDISDAELERLYPGSMDGTNACDPKPTRRYLTGRGLLPSNILPFAYRAFDRRWIYWEPETNLLGRKSPDFFPQVFAGNHFLEARQKESGSVYGRGMVVSILADNFGNGFSNFFPKLIRHQPGELVFSTNARDLIANLTAKAEAYLRSLKLDLEEVEQATLLFFHIIASVHSSAYRTENADALRLDWPRIPLPARKQTLVDSAELGQRIAALLDTEASVKGVTSNPIRQELKLLGPVSRVGGGSLSADELALTAGWGHLGKGGVTMPGKGRTVERDYTPDEVESIRQGAQTLGLTLDDALLHIGMTTFDVYLNDHAYWRNVPAKVWDYTMGGYQVIKKWLSYREYAIQGRTILPAEAREVRDMIRRIAALSLLQPQLEVNYTAAKTMPYEWRASPQHAPR